MSLYECLRQSTNACIYCIEYALVFLLVYASLCRLVPDWYKNGTGMVQRVFIKYQFHFLVTGYFSYKMLLAECRVSHTNGNRKDH